MTRMDLTMKALRMWIHRSRLAAALGLGLVLAACATAPAPPAQTSAEIPQALEASGEGSRFGVMAATLGGKVVRASRADERFIPASNTKLFTAAAAFRLLPDLRKSQPELGTTLHLVPEPDGKPPSLRLAGAGDPTVRDGADCVSNCLHELADAIVRRGITRVTDVYGDETFFPHEPFGLGWSWNNLPFYFGAPVSALTVNGNAAGLRVSPGAAEGAPVSAVWAPGDDVLRLNIEAITSATGSENLLSVLRWPGSDEVQITGSLPAGTPPRSYFLSVPDPAKTATERLVRLLRARGVTVEGGAKVRLRNDLMVDAELARLTPPPLLETVINTAKDSDNLSAEVLLRHMARAVGGESADDGLDAVHAMLDEAGIDRNGIELFDGSGLSPYNRVTPEATVQFLTWTTTQNWGEAFRATLPVGGKAGSLSRRFRGTPLEGRIFAKTGTVQGVNALSGFLTAASGQTLVFSVISNDRAADAAPATPAMDAMLLALAAQN